MPVSTLVRTRARTGTQPKTIAFKWIETREVRPPDLRAYALLNDVDQSVPQGVVEALHNCDVTRVSWAEREAVREELAV